MSTRKKIAAVATVWYARSHADVIVRKFVEGFPTDDGLLPPRTEIASLYVDQFPPQELSRELAAKHRIPIYESIRQALTLGGRELAVDGVLLIGEHGDYPWNERDQQLFPRKCFFEQICGVMATSRRPVPIFNDKHLSWNWADAKWMYDRARQLGAPFMAGSSLPLAWRNPSFAVAPESPLREALVIAYSGLDVYGFHALETLQCVVERRRGGETGVAAVTCLEGDAVWRAAREGKWPRALAEAALAAIEVRPAAGMEEGCPKPALFDVEYRSGLRAWVLMLTGYVEEFAVAVREGEQVRSAEFHLPNAWPYPHFSYLSLNVEEMFLSGTPSYPVERTLLTTGILEAALESRFRGHVRVETPHLDVRYRSDSDPPWRPRRTRPLVPLGGP